MDMRLLCSPERILCNQEAREVSQIQKMMRRWVQRNKSNSKKESGLLITFSRGVGESSLVIGQQSGRDHGRPTTRSRKFLLAETVTRLHISTLEREKAASVLITGRKVGVLEPRQQSA